MYITETKKRLSARCRSILKLIQSIEQQLARLPDGKLRIHRQGKSVSYYLVEEKQRDNGTLIDKDNFKLINGLAQKTYLQKVLKAAQREHKYLQGFINNYPQPLPEDVYYLQNEDRKALTQPVGLSDEEYKERWLSETYQRKGFAEGIPVYMTNKGLRVRSKSEQIIAERLDANDIPYKYEYPVTIDDVVYHPDFKILRMSDRKEIFYEHLGRMDDPGYSQKNIVRLNRYSLNGIVQGDNLVTTMETSMTPLDTRVLDRLIEEVFR
jgi:hypothetical protein